MIESNINSPSLKELETELFRTLQETFKNTLSQILMDIDEEIARNRDTKRFRLKDKRKMTMDCMFGSVELRRNYYYDCEKKVYVYLLDRYLKFEGAKGLSPLIQEAAIELAVSGTSYRHAAKTLEKILGYSVISHESIRQHLIQCETVEKKAEMPRNRVLFVEVDGLYVKRQNQKIQGHEEKIALVHEGWKKNGKRTALINKRHYHHTEKIPFWEGLEQFLMDTYGYNPAEHFLVINGDGAEWITACRNYFKNAFFTIDRFHVARDIRRIFKGHKRYKEIRKNFTKYDAERLMIELNSAVGTLDEEAKEENLKNLISRLSKYPSALTDYRDWLKGHGVEVERMRPMGASEATMRVFAKRLKNGRAWGNKGVMAFIDVFIGYQDKLEIKSMVGKLDEHLQNTQVKKQVEEKKTNRYINKKIVEEVRQNIVYLLSSTGKPMYQAMKGLRGF